MGGKALPRSRFLRNAASPKLLREYDSVLAYSEKQLLALQYIQTDIYKVYTRNNVRYNHLERQKTRTLATSSWRPLYIYIGMVYN